ncbi:hypothetical protein CPB83DRAFT_673763 [Crepidotus variabilis]|uniref:Zinc-ribbon 15 domain-containing protein n=1 Tax=Crepidotus variabilis TaxID=179855 RepID=A0A9P6EP47_9AGAR|nr:hypothetical protein CPB83DRAFT_673763 [Crepidotus variabilis]
MSKYGYEGVPLTRFPVHHLAFDVRIPSKRPTQAPSLSPHLSCSIIVYLVGCGTKVKPEGPQVSTACPRCHNNSVLPAKATTWFELFWVPLIPVSKEHLWICHICQWRQKKEKEEAQPRDFVPPPQYHNNPQSFTAPNVPGYQPSYIGDTAPPSKA